MAIGDPLSILLCNMSPKRGGGGKGEMPVIPFPRSSVSLTTTQKSLSANVSSNYGRINRIRHTQTATLSLPFLPVVVHQNFSPNFSNPPDIIRNFFSDSAEIKLKKRRRRQRWSGVSFTSQTKESDWPFEIVDFEATTRKDGHTRKG